MSVFYDLIEKDIKDEAKDNNKYLELAKIAPTEKARKILTDIAYEESLHHKYLKEILSDRVCTPEDDESEEESDDEDDDDSSESMFEDSKPDYPTNIENVGVDPDVIKVKEESKNVSHST